LVVWSRSLGQNCKFFFSVQRIWLSCVTQTALAFFNIVAYQGLSRFYGMIILMGLFTPQMRNRRTCFYTLKPYQFRVLFFCSLLWFRFLIKKFVLVIDLYEYSSSYSFVFHGADEFCCGVSPRRQEQKERMRTEDSSTINSFLPLYLFLNDFSIALSLQLCTIFPPMYRPSRMFLLF